MNGTGSCRCTKTKTAGFALRFLVFHCVDNAVDLRYCNCRLHIGQVVICDIPLLSQEGAIVFCVVISYTLQQTRLVICSLIVDLVYQPSDV